MIVTVPALGGGLNSDEAPHELRDGEWSRGNNVRFDAGYVGKIKGHADAPITAPAGAVYHVAPYQTPGKRFWIHSGLASTYADDGSTQTDISGTALTGDADDRFTSCTIGGIYVQNNQNDTPRYWDGNTANNLAALTDWDNTWRCKSMRSFRNYLIALNVTKNTTAYPHMVKWSDAAVPGAIPSEWVPAVDNDANERDLAETEDQIVDGLAMGDVFVVYKERSMFGLQFIGGNTIFRSFRMPGNYGALAVNCVVQTPMGHVVLTPGPDLVLHQGGEPQSILTGRMRRWLRSTLDARKADRAFVASNPAYNEVWACLPTGASGNATKALIWNYKDNTFTTRDLPSATCAATGQITVAASADQWNSAVGNWDADADWWNNSELSQADRRLLMGTATGRVYVMDDTETFGGELVAAYVERTGMAFGDAATTKTLRTIYPRIDGDDGGQILIQVGAAMDPEGAYTWSPAVTYTIGESYRADAFATGRFLALRLRSTTANKWRLKSCDFELVKRGSY